MYAPNMLCGAKTNQTGQMHSLIKSSQVIFGLVLR